MLKRTLITALLVAMLGAAGCHEVQTSVRVGYSAGYYAGDPYRPMYADPYDPFYGPAYYYPGYYYPYPFFFGIDYFSFYPRERFFYGRRRFIRPSRSLRGFRGGGWEGRGSFNGNTGSSTPDSNRGSGGRSLR